MKSDGSSEIVQLRQILSERFPHLRQWREEAAAKPAPVWPTALPSLDERLHGGLPTGGITEVVAEKSGTGSAVFLRALVRQARAKGKPIALIDGLDSFDAATLEPAVLSQLLWVRCKTSDEAMKATDILLRDRNLSLVMLDLKMNPAAQLRKISSPTWYRLQRILRQTGMAFVVVTPFAMASSADVRLRLASQCALDALGKNEDEVLTNLHFDLTRFAVAGHSAESMAAEAG